MGQQPGAQQGAGHRAQAYLPGGRPVQTAVPVVHQTADDARQQVGQHAGGDHGMDGHAAEKMQHRYLEHAANADAADHHPDDQHEQQHQRRKQHGRTGLCGGPIMHCCLPDSMR